MLQEEEAMFMDLRPYMNPSPFIVNPHTSLRRTFILFRSLGLRHLCVGTSAATKLSYPV